MSMMRWQRKWVGTSIGLLLILAVGDGLTQAAQAQFGSPPGQGVPKGTAGGGSRPVQSACQATSRSDESLVALAPTQFVGLTAQANPTVWIYVPATTAQFLEFSLFTQHQEGVYQTNLAVTRPGLVNVTLPPQAPKLAPGQPYYWTAALVCNPNRRTDDWLVGGWIQRQPMKAELQQQLVEASPEQQVKLYVQAGFWYEALNTYLELQQSYPKHPSLAALWTDLLRGSGLRMMTEPFGISQAN